MNNKELAEQTITKFIKAIDGITPYPQMRERFINIILNALDQVATEQKKIDIDKAWEWFEPFLKQNDAYIVNHLEELFRKAMEE